MDDTDFRNWTPWLKRQTIDDCDQPGVYLVARFMTGCPAIVNPLANEVVYIGETCHQTLEKRWYQFNRSAFEQKPGHSGGQTFAAHFCDNKVIAPVPWLYVSALTVATAEPHRSAFIRYTERRLIWAYVQQFGQLPICNSK